MTRAYLVRHGRATAGWSTDPDPGLDRLGRQQADLVAERLAAIGPLNVVVSPLRRCQETAEPLCARWSTPARVEPRVAEIPSPEGVAMAHRVDWLRTAMRGTWTALGPRYTAFRDEVAAALVELTGDTVVFSHFVAINAAIGAAIGEDAVVIRSLDNCSITVVEIAEGALHLIEAGHEADTLIR